MKRIVVEVDDSHMAFIRQQARLTDPQPRVRLDFEHFMALIPGRVVGVVNEDESPDYDDTRDFHLIETLEG